MKMLRWLSFLPVLVAALLVLHVPVVAEEKARQDPDRKAVVEGNTQFALDLYAKLKDREGNLFFSPYSISTALAMTYAGARGETAKQMADVLHFTLVPDRLHPAFGGLQGQLDAVQKKGNVELSVANALWAQKDYIFLKEFLGLTGKHYGAGLKTVDFKNATEAARQEINAWVERETKERIKELIRRGILEDLTCLVLTNAIYFKGMWASRFKKIATREMPFWIAPETSVNTPMMRQTARFRYRDEGDLQILELPYVGHDLSMVVLLPEERDGLAALEGSVNVERLNAWLGRVWKRDVMVLLPRFTMTSEFSLGRQLISMGMRDAFDGRTADFSGMNGQRGLFISAVLHKAFVDMNEEGTEAAAATAVVMSKEGPSPAPVFLADHPFLFLIRHNPSGSILFMGRVVNPKE